MAIHHQHDFTISFDIILGGGLCGAGAPRSLYRDLRPTKPPTEMTDRVRTVAVRWTDS